MTTVRLSLLLGLLLPGFALLAAPQGGQTNAARAIPAPRSVVILARDSTDPRIELTREALLFWQDTFRELELEPIFTDTRVLEPGNRERAIESYARLLSQQAGRPGGPASGVPGAPRNDPPSPPELLELNADLVILLSRQNLMPFAWPIRDGLSHLVAARSPARGRSLDPDASRNEIAHELGHVLGLEHHREGQRVLMCMPCGAPDPKIHDSSILPLTERDLTRLRSSFMED